MERIPVIRQLFGFLGWIVVAFAASAVGGLGSIDSGSFYQQLILPAWAPPGWVFAPVWTVFYFIMGIAAWLVWREGGFCGARAALSLFLIQLAANALWTWVFFAWRRGAWASFEILLLWILIGAAFIAFYRIRPLAAALLIPYWAWVGFAGVLTYRIWKLNPSILG